MFSCVMALYICVRATQAVLQSYISVSETHRLCWGLIYLCQRHAGCVAGLSICVRETQAVLQAYISV